MGKIYIRIIRPILHFIIILIIFFLTYKIRLTTDLIPGVQLRIPLINKGELQIFAIISGFVFIFLGIIKKLYELHKPTQNYFKTFSKVWIYRFITITFIAFFGQGFIFVGGISRFIIGLSSLITFFMLFFFDQIRNYVESINNRNSEEKILIVTDNLTNSYESINKIKKGFSYKTELIQSGDIEEINIKDYFTIVAIGNFEKDNLQNIFEKVRLTNTRFYHISEGYFLEDVVYTPETIDNIVALEYKHSRLDGRSIILKRIFDIFASSLGIILFTPIMIILAIIIKLDSPGPTIFKHKRVGSQGNLFTFIKFRSMVKNADKQKDELMKNNERQNGPLFKLKNDPRITKFGKLLRKTSLDELPQLFLVLIGKMSIVGPRPHLPEEVNKYQERQKRLLSIKPGITGYAQIFGRDNLSFDDEAKLDLYYIQNRSIFMDIYIIFATFKVVFKGK